MFVCSATSSTVLDVAQQPRETGKATVVHKQLFRLVPIALRLRSVLGKSRLLEKSRSSLAAQRDIQGLIDQGILVKDSAGGRSTSYSLFDR